MIDNKTFYQILEVDNNSSFDEIKKSYRRLSFLYHPDKNPSKEEDFKKINSAYEVLSDARRRQEYDMTLRFSNGTSPYSDFDVDIGMDMNMNGGLGFMGGILEGLLNSKLKSMSKNRHSNNKSSHKGGNVNMDEFFKIFTNPPTSPQDHDFDNIFMFNGADLSNKKEEHICPEEIHVDKSITFEESYFGCCIPIQITRDIVRGNKTIKENEKIYLTIPKGVDDDEIVTIQNKGNVINDRQSDVKVHLKVEKNDNFFREGLNLIYKKNVSFRDSLCGFEFLLEHINGKKMKLSSSRGNVIQNGDKKILKNMGFNRNDKEGDLIILFKVLHPPETLTDEQLNLIEKLF